MGRSAAAAHSRSSWGSSALNARRRSAQTRRVSCPPTETAHVRPFGPMAIKTVASLLVGIARAVDRPQRWLAGARDAIAAFRDSLDVDPDTALALDALPRQQRSRAAGGVRATDLEAALSDRLGLLLGLGSRRPQFANGLRTSGALMPLSDRLASGSQPGTQLRPTAPRRSARSISTWLCRQGRRTELQGTASSSALQRGSRALPKPSRPSRPHPRVSA